MVLKQHLTFTLVLIPGVDTVLHAIAHQRVVYAHVAVTEEGICITGSWKGNEHHRYHSESFFPLKEITENQL